MFWAALAAQCADETHLTRNRIVVSLLRTDAVRQLCQHLQIAPAKVIEAVEDPRALSFEECERRVRSDLAESGLELGSKEHQASVQLRPLDPVVKHVFDTLLERDGQLAVTPLELLLVLLRADPPFAQRVADRGLTVGAISAAIEEQ
jgi:hypothetical protein